MKKKWGYWTKKKCQQEALKYNSKTEFQKKSLGAYDAAYRNNWLCLITKHMKKLNLKWTKENCIKEIIKYKTKTEFNKGASGAYDAAYDNGWLNELYIIAKF